jgi:hypothetical protein
MSRGMVAAFSDCMNTINLVTVDMDESRDASAQGDLAAVANGLLETLDRTKTTATFFLSRPVVERDPEVARRLADHGHEVACLTTERPSQGKPYCAKFTSELEVTRDALEQATGRRVRGHRNASFAVNYESEWVYDVLVDRGFEYDSSRIPPRYVEFGYQPVPKAAHVLRRWGGTLLEIPVSTADVLSMRLRLGTTGNVRGLPLPLWSALVESRQARGEPMVMHLRAQELRRNAGIISRGAPADLKALERVSRIVGRFSFTSVANSLPDLRRNAPIIES